MFPERPSTEGSLSQEFQALRVSKNLVRSVSQKMRKRAHQSGGNDEEVARGFSLGCLSLYGRGGGCKVGAEICDHFADSNCIRSSTSEEGKGYKPVCASDESEVDCFTCEKKERLWRRNIRKTLDSDDTQRSSSRLCLSLPDDILEMCLMRLPLASLMNARLVCKKWNQLTKTSRFMQMRSDGLYETPWLFLFGTIKDGYCSGEVLALDTSHDQWHNINAECLRGRFLFSVTSIWDEIFVVGGCTSFSNFGRMDRSSFRTHKSMLGFTPSSKSWRRAAPMKYARSSPVLGISEVSADFSFVSFLNAPQDTRFPRSRIGGVLDVYEDPHRLSVRRELRNDLDGNSISLVPFRKQSRSLRHNNDADSKGKELKRFVLISIGGLGSWDDALDSGEIYDSLTNKWMEIQKLPIGFGSPCSGVVCGGMFFVYSVTDKLAGYDIERGYWIEIQTSPPPPRVHEYYPKLVSCNGRLFMLSVSWCEGDGQIGRRNKAVRKMWELNLDYLTWAKVSVHPDAPMDWNTIFVAEKGLIFGVEMFKIFGQVLDFVTVCDFSSSNEVIGWSHISRNRVAHELDASSCMTKTVAVLYL